MARKAPGSKAAPSWISLPLPQPERNPPCDVIGICRLQRHASELLGYFERNEDAPVHYSARRRCGEPISLPFLESAVNEIVSKLMNKRRKMRSDLAIVQISSTCAPQC